MLFQLSLVCFVSLLCALIISGIAYACYPFVWWYQNRDNKVLEESANALGGGLGQFND